MKYLNAQFGYLYLLVPLLLFFFIWAFRSRKRALQTFAEKPLLTEILTSPNLERVRWKAIILILGITLLLTALMGPSWGFRWQEVRRRGVDVMIAVDTSKSMLAADIKPNRLERTRLEIKEFSKSLRGDRVGLIAFAGGSFVQTPLTIDYNALALALDALSTDIIPQGGTNIPAAIKTALVAFEKGKEGDKVLIIITDGENHEGDAVEAAKRAAAEGVTIFTIGIGTREGEIIRVIDEEGRLSFLKDGQDRVVKSRLDEVTLQKVALATGGGYVRATAAEFGLDLIYNDRIAKMEGAELDSTLQKRYQDRFQIPLVLTILLLCLEVVLGERVSLKGRVSPTGRGTERK